MNLSGIFEIIYEDNHLLVVNKSGGVLVQGDKTGDKPLVEYCKDYIKKKYNKPGEVFLGVVHRLDRPVSGLVIFAKTSKALERMNQLFKNNEIHKTYWAIVLKPPPSEEGTLVHYLKKDPARNISKAYHQQVENSKRCELSYRLISKIKNHYLLEVYPVTGRPHQIRVQLAAMGCVIRGDLKYGYPTPNTDGNISLHAKKVAFIHPVQKQPFFCEAPLPQNDAFWNEN